MQILDVKNKLISFYNYILHINKGSLPLFHVFETAFNKYMYDTGTNKILVCTESEYSILSYISSNRQEKTIDVILSLLSKVDIINAIESINSSIIKENILKSSYFIEIESHFDVEWIKERIEYRLEQLILEITENCNLRCKYCVYNKLFKEKRNHGVNNMNIDIICKAIDYINKNTHDNEITISFYGGEPILNIRSIIEAVNYARRVISHKNVKYSITTNATLITDEIAKYLYECKFVVLVSLDGPELIHNMWRKDINGEGSYNKTIDGIKRLLKYYNNKPELFGISSVYAPPYSKNKIEEINHFIYKSSLFKENVNMTITYPTPGSINPEFEDNSLNNWLYEKYYDDYIKKQNISPLVKSLISRRLYNIFKRAIVNQPTKIPIRNGCCAPGSRKLYVSSKGKYHICERISGAPDIGDVNKGINYDIIADIYYNNYLNISKEECSKCWFVRLCDLCYIHAFRNGKINIENKKVYCKIRRITASKDISFMCSLIENNKNGLDYLKEWKIH